MQLADGIGQRYDRSMDIRLRTISVGMPTMIQDEHEPAKP